MFKHLVKHGIMTEYCFVVHEKLVDTINVLLGVGEEGNRDGTGQTGQDHFLVSTFFETKPRKPSIRGKALVCKPYLQVHGTF